MYFVNQIAEYEQKRGFFFTLLKRSCPFFEIHSLGLISDHWGSSASVLTSAVSALL